MLHELNRRFAPILHRDALLSSMFVKPLAYAGELERRIILELAADVPAPHHVDVMALDGMRFLEFEA